MDAFLNFLANEEGLAAAPLERASVEALNAQRLELDAFEAADVDRRHFPAVRTHALAERMNARTEGRSGA